MRRARALARPRPHAASYLACRTTSFQSGIDCLQLDAASVFAAVVCRVYQHSPGPPGRCCCLDVSCVGASAAATALVSLMDCVMYRGGVAKPDRSGFMGPYCEAGKCFCRIAWTQERCFRILTMFLVQSSMLLLAVLAGKSGTCLHDVQHDEGQLPGLSEG